MLVNSGQSIDVYRKIFDLGPQSMVLSSIDCGAQFAEGAWASECMNCANSLALVTKGQ